MAACLPIQRQPLAIGSQHKALTRGLGLTNLSISKVTPEYSGIQAA